MGNVIEKILIGVAIIGAAFIPGVGPLLAGHLAVALIGIGSSLVLGGVTQALTKPKSGSTLNNPAGRQITVRQAAAPGRVVYGFGSTGGVLTFINQSNNGQQLQVVITIVRHDISSDVTIYFDGEPIAFGDDGNALGRYAGKAFRELNLGNDGDTAFPSLINDAPGLWTANHRQRGCAGVYMRLNFDEKLFPRGLPNITFAISGKGVFDPRSDSPLAIQGVSDSSPSGTTVIQCTGHGFAGGESVRIRGVLGAANANGECWGIDVIDADHFSLQGSDAPNGAYTGGGTAYKLTHTGNAALCTNDYLISQRIGLGADYATEIDEDALIAAANICDESITLDTASPPSTENRYQTNGAFDMSELPGQVIQQMANAMAGYVTYVSGKWAIFPGAFRIPVMTLTDSDVVAPMQVQSKRSLRDLFNGEKGTYVEPTDWQETDFPAVTNPDYVSEDNGEQRWKDVFLPFTITNTCCQRIAKIDLERNRRQVVVQMTAMMRAYQLQPCDVVEFTHPRFGWTEKTFEVAQTQLTLIEGQSSGSSSGSGDSAGGGLALAVQLTLNEIDEDVYGFAVDDYGNPVNPDLLDSIARKIPYGWGPSQVREADSLATFGSPAAPGYLRPIEDWSFGIAQRYRIASDGSTVPQLMVSGRIPINLLSTLISRPRTRNLVATTSPTGGFLKGGRRYFIAVCGNDQVDLSLDGNVGRYTALSEIASVDVPPGTDTNTVMISGLKWHANNQGWALFFGEDYQRLSYQDQFGGVLVPGTTTITGPDAKPTSITFLGFPTGLIATFPDGFRNQYISPPDLLLETIKVAITRAPHLGIWGGEVVSVSASSPPGQYLIQLGTSGGFSVNALAGRFVSLVGIKDTGLELGEGGGMPLADLLIESNTADTLTLAANQANPASIGFAPYSVVVIRTQATAVGEDALGNYLEDSQFGYDGQNLGDKDPSSGGGDDSLKGMVLRFISGTGKGDTYIIRGYDVAAKWIYIEGDWLTTPDSTTVFIVTEAHPSVEYETEKLAADNLTVYSQLRIDVANLLGEQFLVQAFTRSHDGHQADENSSPYREIYLFGQAEPGELIVSDTTLEPSQSYVRVAPGSGSPPGDVTITLTDARVLPGRKVVVAKVDDSPHTVTVQPPAGHAGDPVVLTNNGDSAMFMGYDD